MVGLILSNEGVSVLVGYLYINACGGLTGTSFPLLDMRVDQLFLLMVLGLPGDF